MMHDIRQMTYDAHHTLLVYFRVCIAFAECHIMYLMIALIIALHHC